MAIKKPNRAVCSAADILGTGSNKIKKAHTITKCIICERRLPKERLDALQLLNIPRTQYTCVEHSTISKIKGIYSGEVGTSKLILCNKIYDDTVRSVFKRTENETDETEEEDELVANP